MKTTPIISFGQFNPLFIDQDLVEGAWLEAKLLHVFISS